MGELRLNESSKVIREKTCRGLIRSLPTKREQNKKSSTLSGKSELERFVTERKNISGRGA